MDGQNGFEGDGFTVSLFADDVSLGVSDTVDLFSALLVSASVGIGAVGSVDLSKVTRPETTFGAERKSQVGSSKPGVPG